MNKAMVYHSASTRSDKNGHYEEACKKGEVVHSGHFMISSVADDQEENEDIDLGRDSPIHYEQNRMIQLGYDFSNVPKETKNTYQFGPLPTNQITIDASLSRLFQCMSLAYQGGKVVSPKWKNFKGMKLTVKDKIRLNNAIWRTWHIQYVMRKRKEQSLIQFATPMEVDYNSHARPEAVVMEGKYWKRRIETVVAEYKKWRAFFMNKLRLSDYPGLLWVSDNANTSLSKEVAEFDKSRATDDAGLNDFSDTLFSSLCQQPFQFPNPREIAMHATNSDMIQPGLLQLQPAVEDYMDLDSFHEWFSPAKKSMVSFSGASNQVFPQSDSEIFESGDLANMLEAPSVEPPAKAPLVSNNNNQSMDLVTNFQMQTKPLEVQYLNQPVPSADPPIFSSFNINAPSYPATRMQQQQQQPPPMQQMPPTVSNTNQTSLLPQYSQVEQPKIYPISNDNMLQQQVPIKPNDSRNRTFVRNNNTQRPVANGNLQSIYPHSKLGTNSTSNRVVYSQPQTAQQVEYFSQNQSHVLMQQNVTNNAMQGHHVQPHDPHGGDLVLNQVANPANTNQILNPVNNTVSEFQQLQQQAGNAINMEAASSSNVAPTTLLKQLVANSNTSLPPQGHPSRMNRNQEIRSKQVHQVPAPVMQISSPPLANIMPGAPRGPKPGPAMAPAKNVIEEIRPDLSMQPKEPWPQAAFTAMSSSPVKSSVHDVDMEQVTLEPLSPDAQDADFSQVATVQRQGSFSTEQKRRFNIKIGFTRMLKMLPGGNLQSNAKASKATLMHKAVQYITAMQAETKKMNEEIRLLKEELANLQLSISAAQQQLPTTGAPVPRQRTEEAKVQFRAWARQRTKQDWKFYLFGVVIRPWFESYQKEVSVRTLREFNQSVFEWLDTHCSLPVLRPSIVQSLQVLSTTTNILTNPSLLRQQIEGAVVDRDQPSQDARSRHDSSRSTS